MSAETHIARHVFGPLTLFRDRDDAGCELARWIGPAEDTTALVFALPRGGVPVARPLAEALGCELRPALVRKLPIPSDPEMGFGAVAIDGGVRLNDAVVRAFAIRPDVVENVVAEVRGEVERRSAAYPGGWPLPPLVGRNLWLVDDGLATGLTALVAVDMLRRQEPASVSVAVPCAPSESITRVAEAADAVWCIASQQGHPFAVASFYSDFHDLSDAEVRAILEA